MFFTINGKSAETSLPNVIPVIILRTAYLQWSKLLEFNWFFRSVISSTAIVVEPTCFCPF